jgi:hypothetical protein
VNPLLLVLHIFLKHPVPLVFKYPRLSRNVCPRDFTISLIQPASLFIPHNHTGSCAQIVKHEVPAPDDLTLAHPRQLSEITFVGRAVIREGVVGF